MTEQEKMMSYHAMQTIKEAPEWSQEINLVLLCNADKSGRTERLARILADYGMDLKKIAPCIMAIMQDFLVDIECNHEQVANCNE